MDLTRVIKDNLRLEPVPGLPQISLYTAHAGSRLSRLGLDAAPYWAWPWAGGLALAHYIASDPAGVQGRAVLDLGAGSGLVGIVAAKLGAIVSAAEIDPAGRAAIALNAAANTAHIKLVEVDVDGPPPKGFDTILAGDVFYETGVAARMLPFLERCVAVGMTVLIGDPGRRDLPLHRLEKLAQYAVGDVGDARDKADRVGTAYRLKAI